MSPKARMRLRFPMAASLNTKGRFSLSWGRWTASRPVWTSAELYKGNTPAIPGTMDISR